MQSNNNCNDHVLHQDHQDSRKKPATAKSPYGTQLHNNNNDNDTIGIGMTTHHKPSFHTMKAEQGNTDEFALDNVYGHRKMRRIDGAPGQEQHHYNYHSLEVGHCDLPGFKIESAANANTHHSRETTYHPQPQYQHGHQGDHSISSRHQNVSFHMLGVIPFIPSPFMPCPPAPLRTYRARTQVPHRCLYEFQARSALIRLPLLCSHSLDCKSRRQIVNCCWTTGCI